MKTMTFHINKSNKNSNNIFHTSDTTNYSKIIDAIITSNIKAKNPYLFETEETGWDNFKYTTKKKPITIDITLNKKNKCQGCPLKDICKYDYTTFEDAINFLSDYEFGKNDYDFKLSDGTPVKIFGDGSLQIGYDLYYPTNGYHNIFDILDEPKKKSIIDIYIKLK